MNILCIVTNNELRLKTLIKNLPTNRNYEIVFVTDPRICSMISTINELYPYANIITSLNILDGFYTEYSCKTKNFEKYALGYKMLVPYYLRLKLNFDKLLMVDDDIIVTEKLNDLFDEIEHPSSKITGIMNKNSRDNKISYEIKNLAYNIFEIE